MKKAIVLSGGGSHGAYQIGVWRALKKLHFNYDIVTGTSVGAINGILMVEQDLNKAIYMWKKLDFSMVFEEKITNEPDSEDGKKEIAKMYAKNLLFNGGMDVSRLEETITQVIDIPKVYKSNVDFGLITVKLPSLSPISLTKKEISKIDLKDYIIASATCFPFFKKKQIKNDLYIDGGYYDNLPINLAIEMGAEEIIAVDLRTIGLKKKVKNSDAKITYISPNNNLGSFLFFDKSLSIINMEYGYNDAMKVFNKLDGVKYTFKKDNLEHNFDKYYYKYINKLELVFDSSKLKKDIYDKILMISSYKYLLNYDLKKSQSIIIKTIEYLGEVFKFDDYKIYDIKKYNKCLIDKVSSNNSKDRINDKDLQNNKKLNIFDRETIITFLYHEIKEYKLSKKKKLLNYALLFQKEFLAAIYLNIIEAEYVKKFSIFSIFKSN